MHFAEYYIYYLGRFFSCIILVIRNVQTMQRKPQNIPSNISMGSLMASHPSQSLVGTKSPTSSDLVDDMALVSDVQLENIIDNIMGL